MHSAGRGVGGGGGGGQSERCSLPHNGLFFPPGLRGFNLSARGLVYTHYTSKDEVKHPLIQHMKRSE